MQIFSECNLAQIVSELLNGQTLVFPTETSYGLGCDATNLEAVEKIFKIKGRKNDKPLLVVVPSVDMAKKYLVWNENLDKIASKYWPGAVTVVGECKSIKAKVHKGESLANGVVSKENTVAVRVTAHPLLQSITEKLGRPLVATSANIADAGDVYDSKKIVEIFAEQKNQPDIVLDYGTLEKHLPTTIVSVVNNELKILRQGETRVKIKN